MYCFLYARCHKFPLNRLNRKIYLIRPHLKSTQRMKIRQYNRNRACVCVCAKTYVSVSAHHSSRNIVLCDICLTCVWVCECAYVSVHMCVRAFDEKKFNLNLSQQQQQQHSSQEQRQLFLIWFYQFIRSLPSTSRQRQHRRRRQNDDNNDPIS